MRFAADYSHDNIDKMWNKWNNHQLKLQGIEVVEEPDREIDEDGENDSKRRRRSRYLNL